MQLQCASKRSRDVGRSQREPGHEGCKGTSLERVRYNSFEGCKKGPKKAEKEAPRREIVISVGGQCNSEDYGCECEKLSARNGGIKHEV